MIGILTGPNASPLKTGPLSSVLKSSSLINVSGHPCRCDSAYLAQAQLTDVSQANDVTFGEWPEGRYIIRVCGGAFKFGEDPKIDPWAVSRAPHHANNPPGSEGWFVSFHYKDQSGWKTVTSNEPVPGSGSNGYASEADAERGGCNHSAAFNHCGGEIKLSFVDEPYNDNSLGSKPPTYRLYGTAKIAQCFFCSTSVGEYITYSGPPFFYLNFNFHRTCALAVDLEVQLQSSGGITPTDLDWVPLSLSTQEDVPYLTFVNATSSILTATFKIKPVCAMDLSDIVVEFAPILWTVVIGHGRIWPEVAQCGFTRYAADVQFTNIGNISTRNLVATVTAVSGAELLRYGNYCTVVSSNVRTVGQINKDATAVLSFHYKQSGSGDAVFDIALVDGSDTHPTARITIPW